MDLIDRQDAIDALGEEPEVWEDPYEISDLYSVGERNQWRADRKALENVPSAEPTLYGYKIEHLAYIAMVMEKEGVTAEYAVRTFDDMGRAVKMVIDEVHEAIKRSMEEWIQT